MKLPYFKVARDEVGTVAVKSGVVLRKDRDYVSGLYYWEVLWDKKKKWFMYKTEAVRFWWNKVRQKKR